MSLPGIMKGALQNLSRLTQVGEDRLRLEALEQRILELERRLEYR